MKRHPCLQPFSRDHHQALVQARILILASAESDDLTKIAANFARYWQNDLETHFSQEEQFVLPLLSPDNADRQETLRQHAVIRQLIDELRSRMTSQERIEAGLLQTLGDALRHHIRFEENDLFPAIEASATEAKLRRMNELIESERSRTGRSGCELSPKLRTMEVRE
ncbi:MAG: hemerythrin domain-containing protein [Acidobacteria bacterium]|nr:hemerythrin domain-containing protein [Acidobacteriota bacterium]